MSRGILLSVGVALALSLAISPLRAQPQPDNFIIIEIHSGPILLNPAVEVLQQGNTLFLPLSYITQDLQVPVTYNSATQQLTGWLENEANTVAVNFAKLTGRVGKKMFDFSPEDFLYYEKELFVSSALVDKILDTHSQFDSSSQELRVTTAGNLPFEKELSRHQKQQRFDQVQKNKELARQQDINRDVYVQEDWLQWPFVDLSARYGFNKNTGQKISPNFNYSANISLLTGGFDTQFNAHASTNNEPPILSINTVREDETGQILGLFKHLELGDTYAYANAENVASPYGWGVKMSTESALEAEGKTYTFRDTLPLGWEVELYRNGELLGYQNQTENGFFEFADINLLLGKNTFKLVFYGPQGQVKERKQVVFFNGNILNKGKGRLRLNYINKNRYLIQTHDSPRESSLGHSALAEAGYGITNNLTVNVSAIANSLELTSATPPETLYRKDKEFMAADLSLFAYGIFSSVGSVVDFDRSAATFNYYGQTERLGWDVVLEHTYYGKAITSRNLYNDTYIKNETSLRLNKNLSLGPLTNLPFSYSFRRFDLVNGLGTQTEQTLSLSKSFLRNLYVNGNYQNSQWFSGQRDERLSVNANYLNGPWTVRSGGIYDFVHDRMSNAEVSIFHSLTPRLKGGVRYAYTSRNLSQHAYESLYSANLSWSTHYGYISLEAGTSSWHNSYAFIGYNVSLIPDVLNRRVYTSATKLQGTGAVSAFAFMDANANGMFDEKETILEEAQFTVNPRVNIYDSYKEVPSGGAVLTHLPSYRPFEMSVDTSQVFQTLSLLNTSGPQTLRLRPAQMVYLSFPIVGTGDIEGTVYRQNEKGSRKPMRGMKVNLYKEDQLVSSRVSEFDGYYSFAQVPMGHYTIKLDPVQAQELSIAQTSPLEIFLHEMEQLEVHDIVLKYQKTKKSSSKSKRNIDVKPSVKKGDKKPTKKTQEEVLPAVAEKNQLASAPALRGEDTSVLSSQISVQTEGLQGEGKETIAEETAFSTEKNSNSSQKGKTSSSAQGTSPKEKEQTEATQSVSQKIIKKATAVKRKAQKKLSKLYDACRSGANRISRFFHQF